MKTYVWNALSTEEQRACLQRPVLANNIEIEKQVTDICQNVRKNGDDAVREYTARFDGVTLKSFTADSTPENLDPAICAAINTAYNNIKTFHAKQGFNAYTVETMPGVHCQRVVRPLENVGLYVPGGTAPLVSTTLMLGVPAQLSGCPNIVLCTPCNKDGNINPYIIYAAQLCGISQIFKIGGAQAIAAMAYGTQSIPKSDKIFGPGNAYVTEAKIQISRDPKGAAIDMPAGPSEICVIANDTTTPQFVAADLLSQAEHDTLSQVLLISTSKEKSEEITLEVQKQLDVLPRRDIASAALKNSHTLIADDITQALNIANSYAAEHLILCFENADQYLDQIKHAGSIFLGPWTPESMGDYASGTNHVLPTYGYARNYSGLGVEAFQKTITVQNIKKSGLETLGPTVEKLAMLEGLDAHARAVSIRMDKKQTS